MYADDSESFIHNNYKRQIQTTTTNKNYKHNKQTTHANKTIHTQTAYMIYCSCCNAANTVTIHTIMKVIHLYITYEHINDTNQLHTNKHKTQHIPT